MALPVLLRKLFDNDGAGDKLRKDILPDITPSDNSVTSEKIADGAVTEAKLATKYLPLTGGPLTGNVTVSGSPIYRRREHDSGGGYSSEFAMAADEGDGVSYGSCFSLRSTKDTYNPGGAYIFTRKASDGIGVGVSLEVRADGRMAWGGTTFQIAGDGPGFVGPRFETTRADGHLEFRKYGKAAGFFLDNHPNDVTWYRIVTEYGSYTISGSINAASFRATSDRRQKEDLQEVTPDLSSLKAYRYILKSDGQEHVGLIAQDVEAIIPEAVSEDDKGVKSLDYNAVVAALVSEINALKKRVSTLEKEINYE